MISYNPSIVRNGLVLHLDAANVKSYPGTGTVWKDLSGNGNDVSLVNGPVFSNENGGKFTFDGVNDYAVTINPLNLRSTNAVTVLMLIKVISYGTAIKVLYELSSDFNRYSDSFISSYCDNSVGQNYDVIASIKGNAGYNIASYSKSLLNDSTWHSHCVIHDTSQTSKENLIYNDATIKSELYNPIPNYTKDNTNNFGFRPLYIGCRGGIGYFSYIDLSCVLLYTRALSAAEIQQNFNAMRGRYGI